MPSACGTKDTGLHAPAAARLLSTSPPKRSPRFKPSPVLVVGAAEWWGVPFFTCGNNWPWRATSCGKPPAANTTARRAWMRVCPCGVSNTTLRAPASSASPISETRALSTKDTFKRSADSNKRATKALPFTICWLRPCNKTSRPCLLTRLPT